MIRPASVLALVLSSGSLSGCATMKEADAWVSQSEPRSWAVHSIETAGATLASDLIVGSPWWGYAFAMGAQVGWEIQEARLTDWDVPWWGTAMDLVAPAVTGFALGWWLDSRKNENPGPEPLFDGEADENTETGDSEPSGAPDANHLFPVTPSELLRRDDPTTRPGSR